MSRHRDIEQPYAKDCTWTVDPGPCSSWKMSTERGAMIHCFHWPRPVNSPFRGSILAVHGLSSHTLFQWLRHAPNGERHCRGLWYSGSIVEHVTTVLGMDFYGMDMEGHGESRLHSPPMYMTDGVSGLIEDVFSLLDRIRLDHGLEDNSNIVFMGHSTGCLVLTRAAQILCKRDPLQKVGGLLMTAPLYGIGRLDGTEIPILKSRWLLRAIAFFLRCLNPRKVLYTGYVTESDDRTIPRGVNTQALQKCISPGNLIERWVSGDRDLDPVFFSPYSPIYAGFVAGVMEEIANLHDDAIDLVSFPPLLIIHSRFDPVVPYAASNRFVKVVRSTNQVLFHPDRFMLHNPMLEEDGKEQVNAMIFSWLEKKIILKQ